MITEAHIDRVDQFLRSRNFTTKQRKVVLDLPMLRALQSRLKGGDDSALSFQVQQVHDLFSLADPELRTKISDPSILRGLKERLH